MTGHPQTMPVVDDHRILSMVKNNFHFVIWSMWNYLCDAHERMFPVSLRHVRSLMNCVEITFICIRRCFEKWGTAYCKSKPALFVFRSGSKLFCTKSVTWFQLTWAAFHFADKRLMAGRTNNTEERDAAEARIIITKDAHCSLISMSSTHQTVIVCERFSTKCWKCSFYLWMC